MTPPGARATAPRGRACGIRLEIASHSFSSGRVVVYAIRIRHGRVRPHARHWSTLASLTGVAPRPTAP